MALPDYLSRKPLAVRRQILQELEDAPLVLGTKRGVRGAVEVRT